MDDSSAENLHLPFEPLHGRRIRLAVLISGGGTTLINLHQEISAGRLEAEIPLVIASRPDCAGVDRAAAAGLSVQVMRRRDYDSTKEFSRVVFHAIRDCHADLVVMAGFLSLLTVPPDFNERVINIHPSLIPAFCGKGFHGQHVHEAAIRRGVKFSGCTVHFANNEYDQGPIVLQRIVPVPDGCTADQLAALVFEQETLAYPEAIRLLAEGRVLLNDHRTVIRPPSER